MRTKKSVWLMVMLLLVCCLLSGCGKKNGTNIKIQSSSETQVKSIDHYNEVYKVIKKSVTKQRIERYFSYEDGEKTETVALTNEVDAAASGDAANKGTKFSETNVQVAGIDEGDIIKNEGAYLYVLDNAETGLDSSQIYIVTAVDGKMDIVSHIRFTNDECVNSIYVQKNLLIVLYDKMDDEKTVSYAEFYDITDRSTPERMIHLTQDGSITSSRISDGYLYMVSAKMNYYDDIVERKGFWSSYHYKECIPAVGGNKQPCENIYLTGKEDTTDFLTVSSVCLKDLNTNRGNASFTDSISVMTDADDFFMTDTSIYFTTIQYDNKKGNSQYTEIQRFSYDKGKIQSKAAGKVPGVLLDTFAFNEYNNYLRLVTTTTESAYGYEDAESFTESVEKNGLYILDLNLNQVGCIENIAEGESVKSARFMNDMGYFVTFRQTDPLFSVDLSNPKQPKILGELKIPGFSEYLHFYSDNLILGIGVEVEDDSNHTSGLKLSMFDIADPSNVKEKNKLVLSDYYYSNAMYDYKSVLVEPDKNLIGFDGIGYTDEEGLISYLTFSYDKENGFQMEKEISGNYQNEFSMRGTYIDDTLYVFHNQNKIESYDLTNQKNKIQELELA